LIPNLSLIVLLQLLSPVYAAITIAQAAPDSDFNLFLLLLAVAFGCVVLILIGVGIAIALVVAIASFIFVALGIVSSAVFVGIIRRRFASGLRALHYQVFACLGVPAGMGSLFAYCHLFALPLAPEKIAVGGILAGIAGGLLVALALDRGIVILYRKVMERHPGS
jgi:hypothetical protein